VQQAGKGGTGRVVGISGLIKKKSTPKPTLPAPLINQYTNSFSTLLNIIP
jgi:hypothetical protein